jgi:hypothetical protein
VISTAYIQVAEHDPLDHPGPERDVQRRPDEPLAGRTADVREVDARIGPCDGGGVPVGQLDNHGGAEARKKGDGTAALRSFGNRDAVRSVVLP